MHVYAESYLKEEEGGGDKIFINRKKKINIHSRQTFSSLCCRNRSNFTIISLTPLGLVQGGQQELNAYWLLSAP